MKAATQNGNLNIPATPAAAPLDTKSLLSLERERERGREREREREIERERERGREGGSILGITPH